MKVLVVVSGCAQDGVALRIARRLLGVEGVAHLLYLGAVDGNGIPSPPNTDLRVRVPSGCNRLSGGTAEQALSRAYDAAMAYLGGLLPELHPARVSRSVALGSCPAEQAVSYAHRHAVDVAVVSAEDNGAGVADAMVESGVAPVVLVPRQLLERVTREEAERLVAEHQLAELKRSGRDIVCELYTRRGQGPCAGLDRFTDFELQRIYGPFIEGIEALDSCALRRAVAQFERSRLDHRHLTTCELMREERRLCTGLAQFSNSEMRQAFPQVFAHRIIVE
ncbi:MAG: hypothetical protein WBF37_08730 [Dehalococcoidia bacterium]